MDRDQLVIAHVGLVKAMAHRMAQRLPAQVEMTDLISVGVMGLIDAAGRYKISSAPASRRGCRNRRRTHEVVRNLTSDTKGQ